MSNLSKLMAVAGKNYPTNDTDPFWASVAMLLHFDGADGSTTFTDEKGNTITANGAAALSTVNKKFGTASVLYGVNDFVSFPNMVLTGDYTLECTFYQTVKSPGGGACYMFINFSSANAIPLIFDYVYVGGTGSTGNPGESSNDSHGAMNTWNHFAATRQGTACKIFLNGVMVNSFTGNTNTVTVNRLGKYAGGDGFIGYIDEVRITNGVARYTADFMPPTAAYPNS